MPPVQCRSGPRFNCELFKNDDIPNAQGQLGSGTFGGQAQPAKISGVSAVRAIAAGAQSTHALTADGQIYSWGNNSSAQLGTGTADSSASPVRTLAPGSARYTAVVAAATHVAALASDGGLWVWGGNRFGQLGNGNIAVASDGTPKRVSFPDGSTARVTAVRLGFSSTLALREDGTVWLWGETRQGGTPTYSPQQMSGLPKIVAIAASGYSYSALGVDGSLWAWGRNASISPTTFRSTMSFAQAAGGPFADSMFARDTGGRWWATGYNGYSQLGLGDPSRVQETLPIEVYLPFASTSTVTTVQELFTDKIGPAGERFFLSADVAQSGLLDTLKAADGTYFWGRTGRGFRAWPTRDGAPANVSEVYRFYCLFPDGKPNTHFYTANPADKTALQATNPTNETGKGCRYEGVAFYAVAPSFTAYTGAASAGLVGQSCPSGYSCQASTSGFACLPIVGAPDLCKFCASGQDCSTGNCLTDGNGLNWCSATCQTAANCGAGFQCQVISGTGYCVPTAACTNQCTSAGQCAPGYMCSSGTCRPTGAVGDRCEVSNTCNSCGACVTDATDNTIAYCRACCGGGSGNQLCQGCASTSCAGARSTRYRCMCTSAWTRRPFWPMRASG